MQAKTAPKQYHTAGSPTRRSITLRGVRLHTVLDNVGFLDISISRLRQCDTARNRTRCSVILCGVRLGAVSHCAESHFSRIFRRNHFRLFIRDPNGFDSWKKMQTISWHCLFKESLSQKYIQVFILIYSLEPIFIGFIKYYYSLIH